MSTNTNPAQDLVAQAVAQGEKNKKTATEPVTKRLGYGAFQVRATGCYALLTYTPQGKEAAWILVAADKKTKIGEGKLMRDVIKIHDALVAQGKIKKAAA